MRTRVFLTGATGTWGREVLRSCRERDDVEVAALVLPGHVQDVVMREFFDMPNLSVITGDVLNTPLITRVVAWADVVVHLAGLVSPLADDHPEETRRVNVGGVRSVIQAVRAQPDPSSVALVLVGSVAQYGSRQPPLHWGRVGDPLATSHFDAYGQSKTEGERLLVDSGLERWVWLRQTGIMHAGLTLVRDPIIFHQPLDGALEWVGVEDSARLITALCTSPPPEIWGRVFNVGGGANWRLTTWDIMTRLPGVLGVTDVRKWYERNWFATRNFHGLWFSDSDVLQELVPFREETFEGFLADLPARLPREARLAGRLPPAVIKRFVMEPLARRPRGPLHWMRQGTERHVEAYFGSRRDWEAIGDWSTFEPGTPPSDPVVLDHGYDESLPVERWTSDVLSGVADFRGGRLLSEDVRPGRVADVLDWECAEGHRFSGSPRLVLSAGHWCPACQRDTFGYARQAERNLFLAQVVEA